MGAQAAAGRQHLFSVTSLNDGELRQYDGTLHEVWGVLQRDVAHARAPPLGVPL